MLHPSFHLHFDLNTTSYANFGKFNVAGLDHIDACLQDKSLVPSFARGSDTQIEREEQSLVRT